jgi:hypothetical protein
MRLLLTTFFCLAVLSFESCSDCGECFTPPAPFIFEIVDADTNENLFTNGTYNKGGLTIKDQDDIGIFNFDFITENELNWLIINSIGWKTEKVEYQIKHINDTLFNLKVDATRKSEDCCSFTDYNKIEILDANFTRDEQTGNFIIYVDN